MLDIFHAFIRTEKQINELGYKTGKSHKNTLDGIERQHVDAFLRHGDERICY